VIKNNAILIAPPMNSSIVTIAKVIQLAPQTVLNYHTLLLLSSIVLIYALMIKSQTPRIKSAFQINRIAPMQYLVMKKLVLNFVQELIERLLLINNALLAQTIGRAVIAHVYLNALTIILLTKKISYAMQQKPNARQKSLLITKIALLGAMQTLRRQLFLWIMEHILNVLPARDTIFLELKM